MIDFTAELGYMAADAGNARARFGAAWAIGFFEVVGQTVLDGEGSGVSVPVPSFGMASDALPDAGIDDVITIELRRGASWLRPVSYIIRDRQPEDDGAMSRLLLEEA